MSAHAPDDEPVRPPLSVRHSSPVVSEAITSTALDYLREEQKQRRQEIDSLIARFDGDQRFALAITGGIWSWYATHGAELQRPFSYAAAVLPVVLVLFFVWRRGAIAAGIARNAAYIRRLEELFDLPEGFGWERGNEGMKRTRLTQTTRAFWYTLVAANIALALAYTQLLHWPR